MLGSFAVCIFSAQSQRVCCRAPLASAISACTGSQRIARGGAVSCLLSPTTSSPVTRPVMPRELHAVILCLSSSDHELQLYERARRGQPSQHPLIDLSSQPGCHALPSRWWAEIPVSRGPAADRPSLRLQTLKSPPARSPSQQGDAARAALLVCGNRRDQHRAKTGRAFCRSRITVRAPSRHFDSELVVPVSYVMSQLAEEYTLVFHCCDHLVVSALP